MAIKKSSVLPWQDYLSILRGSQFLKLDKYLLTISVNWVYIETIGSLYRLDLANKLLLRF